MASSKALNANFSSVMLESALYAPHNCGNKSGFLCELNLALNFEPTPSLPENFVEVVAANAQSDMSGMRTVAERNRAFRIIGLLVTACLVNFGASGDYLTSLLRPVVSLGQFAGQALYSVGAGAAIVFRSVGGHLILESNFVGIFLLILCSRSKYCFLP